MSSTGKRDQDDYDGKDNDNNHDGDHADDGTGNEAEHNAINYRELSEMLILLPPPPEQKKIAKILTTLDNAIEKTTKIIEKTKVLKKGLMQRPVNKQKKAGEVLNSVDDDIEKESNYKEQLKSLKKGLIQVLLTGKLRVAV
jgi:restriction endonuclease S subunit